MAGEASHQTGAGSVRGARWAALAVLCGLVAAAVIADQPWTPAVVAGAGTLAGLLIGMWGFERMIAR
ncbi:MAG: hypothetical protein Kow0062_22700 [Acidobacteriota bacterium]